MNEEEQVLSLDVEAPEEADSRPPIAHAEDGPPGPRMSSDELAALQAVLEAGRLVFTCRGCHKTSWRLLIPKHARLGIPCIHCGREAVPAWNCAELLAERAAAAPIEDGEGPQAGSPVPREA